MFLAAILALQAPAPAPAMIFFDSGSSEIRREWQPAIDAAAADARSGRRLIVTGHSDTPGSPAVNRRVALERARAVAAALAALGVPAASLELRSAGEEELMVPTADGVREVQNRRAVITMAP